MSVLLRERCTYDRRSVFASFSWHPTPGGSSGFATRGEPGFLSCFSAGFLSGKEGPKEA